MIYSAVARIVYRSAFVLSLSLGFPSAHGMLSRAIPQISAMFAFSDAVLRGHVIGRSSFENEKGRIETRYTIQVDEPLKGHCPATVSLSLLGGTLDERSENRGCLPELQLGDERLFFLNRDGRGHLRLHTADPDSAVLHPGTSRALKEARQLSILSIQFNVDITDQAASGEDLIYIESASATDITNLFLETTYGLPSRFIWPDRGEPIPYLVDADYLPAGMSLATALNAVSNALAAWKAVAFLDFQYEGLASFGASAADVNIPDGRIRIQLHNVYGEISGTTTLGVGGRGISMSVLPNGWTTGGRVFANDFHHTSYGYVVLNHAAASMQNAFTFEEVLCHEIGHALGMTHSSEDANEPTSSPAYQAIMYYRVHADNRGADPREWDVNVLHQAHPANNPPPYSFDRMMDIITANPTPAISGINEILLTGDIQANPLTPELYDPTTTYGTFTLVGNALHFTPAGSYSESGRLNPAGNSSYDRVYYRLDDGTHASPYSRVRVLSFSPDTKPSGAIDGIPDNWMLSQFGNADPAAAPNRGAWQDYDGDTLNNMQEYHSWMDPTLAASAQRLSAKADGTVSWQGKAYELYELWCSTNLSDWTFVRAIVPTNDVPEVQCDFGAAPLAAYRVVKVP